MQFHIIKQFETYEFYLVLLFYLILEIYCETHTHIHTHTYIFIYEKGNSDKNMVLIGQVGGVFANGPGDLGSIPGRVLPKTLKMGLDTSLLHTQQYKVCIKGKVEKSRERSSTLPYTMV